MHVSGVSKKVFPFLKFLKNIPLSTIFPLYDKFHIDVRILDGQFLQPLLMTQGILYIVSTPIGNLKDITLRALEVLKEVDYILSEDTRETAKFLKAYSIEKSQISYREQNHNKVIDKIVNDLKSGQNLALVSDSGTPLISDPGFKLVERVTVENIIVASIPGPVAAVSALSISGLPTDKFCFVGFLPRTLSHRRNILASYGSLEATLIIYESPFRVVKLLEEILGTLGNRTISIVSEVTKVNEKARKGAAKDMLKSYENTRIKGEFVVLIAKEGY